MNVSLTAELESFIETEVQSGLYHSASEVVRDGLRMMIEKRKTHDQKLAALRHDIQLAIEQSERGESTPWDLEEFLTAARERRAARRSMTEKLDV